MNKNDFIIRLETKNDYYEVENLAREAFWNLSFPGCSEHYFMHVLRQHEAFIPELDYVVEYKGKTVGSVMYSVSKLIDENGSEKPVLTMGPICVLPEFQRKGLSKMLLEYTFAKAVEMGYDTVINFGNPDNYVARGYKSCKKFNVSLENDCYPAALLVKELKAGALDGRKWVYYQNNADAPCDNEEEVERYDSLFPPKVKAWQPSQEEFYIHSHSSITW
ncbi:MAG: N-acetyltransferase [Ruminococcus sp.]|nr:N-acetyltransferase [Ruminococcus sp.]HRR77661.1 N-acetyltransferase [Ruminococcus sp.]